MPKLKINGVPPLDGEYELEVGSFTNRELHTIKEVAGVRAGELKAAMEAADNDLVVAFAVIVLRRAGKQVNQDQLWDAELGAISFEIEPAEAVVRPPISASPSGNESSPAESDAENGSTTRSGGGSNNAGDELQNAPSPTGLRGLAIAAASESETLAS